MLKNGFYAALGTPIKDDGHIDLESLKREVELMTESKTSGVLLMGSMGIEPCVDPADTGIAAKTVVEAANGKCAVFVGVMDNSIHNIFGRIEQLKGLNIDGIVVTAPFYFKLPDPMLVYFFKTIAEKSPFPVYIYDLPGVTKHKITYEMVKELAKDSKIAGIKTQDYLMINKINTSGEVKKDFTVLFSNLDYMDVGAATGIHRYLDGMFTATPKNARLMAEALESGDIKKGGEYLKKIISLRTAFLKGNLMANYSAAMNALGMSGNFAPDYLPKATEEQKAQIIEVMKEIGEL